LAGLANLPNLAAGGPRSRRREKARRKICKAFAKQCRAIWPGNWNLWRMGTGEHAIAGRTATCWKVAVVGMGVPAAGAMKDRRCLERHPGKKVSWTNVAEKEAWHE